MLSNMINWDNPIQSAMIALVASFVVITTTIYFWKPEWAYVKIRGEDIISRKLLLSVSLTAALTVSIIVLISRSKKVTKKMEYGAA
jgi:hypothetical protein